jgi:hypothetical protein
VQSVLGGAKIEYFKRKQGADDHHAPGCATVDLTVSEQVVPGHFQPISDITTVCSHFDLLVE